MTELRERKMERVQASQRDAATTVQRLPSLWAASAARISAELKAAFRDWQSMLFNMALPALMMIVFGSVFKGKIQGTNVDYRVMFIAGMIAVGIMSACFQTLAIGVTLDRDEGLIRRLAASPMMRPAYFVGIMVKTLVMTLLEVVIIVGLGVVLYNLPIPTDPARWLTLAWVILLGVSSCSLAGIAYTAVIPNARAAAAAATPPFMILQLISGVFFPLAMIPAVMKYIAYVFPLAWMAKGLRYVFLPDSLVSNEPGGSWELDRVALMLLAWTIGGLVLSALTFKWRGQRVK